MTASSLFAPLAITLPVFVSPARVGDVVRRRVVVTADTTTTVPAGRFRAIRYASSGIPLDRSDFWFVVRGIGVVRRDFAPVLSQIGDSVIAKNRSILSLESLRRP